MSSQSHVTHETFMFTFMTELVLWVTVDDDDDQIVYYVFCTFLRVQLTILLYFTRNCTFEYTDLQYFYKFVTVEEPINPLYFTGTLFIYYSIRIIVTY
jgi:hypothetical protein